MDDAKSDDSPKLNDNNNASSIDPVKEKRKRMLRIGIRIVVLIDTFISIFYFCWDMYNVTQYFEVVETTYPSTRGENDTGFESRQFYGTGTTSNFIVGTNGSFISTTSTPTTSISTNTFPPAPSPTFDPDHHHKQHEPNTIITSTTSPPYTAPLPVHTLYGLSRAETGYMIIIVALFGVISTNIIAIMFYLATIKSMNERAPKKCIFLARTAIGLELFIGVTQAMGTIGILTDKTRDLSSTNQWKFSGFLIYDILFNGGLAVAVFLLIKLIQPPPPSPKEAPPPQPESVEVSPDEEEMETSTDITENDEPLSDH